MTFTTAVLISCAYIFIGTLVSAVSTDESKPLNMGIVALWPLTVVSFIFLAICACFYALGKRINNLGSRK